MPSNTHAHPSSLLELEAWFGDTFQPYLISGVPTVPASSLTLGAFASRGYVRGADGELIYVTQPAIDVTLAAVNGIHWLALHEDTSTVVASWSRRAGSHYLFRQTASQPASPTGALVTCKVTVAGAVITAVERVASQNSANYVTAVDVRAFGAVGDGTTDDTAAIAAAIDAGTTIIFPQGYTFRMASTITLPAKDVIMIGFGANITVGAATGAFKQTTHGKLTKIRGVRFTGVGPGYVFLGTPSGTEFYEYEITSCRFEQDTTIFGISLTGGREGLIADCYFETCYGIYRTTTVNTEVRNCTWKNVGYCVRDDGQGSANSAGLKVIGGTALGAANGIHASSVDWVLLQGLMLDFCDVPVLFEGVDRFAIQGCFLASRTATATLTCRTDAGTAEVCRSGMIQGNVIQGYYTGGNTFSCLALAQPQDFIVMGNDIVFYTDRGISLTGTFNTVLIFGNTVSPRATFGVSAINFVSTTGDSTVRIAENRVGQAITNQSNAVIYSNRGFVTENKGEAVFLAAAVSGTIAHGLGITPVKNMVSLTPTNAAMAAAAPYISAVDATNITVVFTALGADGGIAWHVAKEP